MVRLPIIKGLMSSLINAVTLCLVMSALNLVIDWRNYILIALFIVFGTFHIMTYGFIVCALIRKFRLKKEIVVVFEVVFLWLSIYIKEDNYFLPVTIFKTQLEGIFMNDILYSKFQLSEILSYTPLWISLSIIFVLIIKVVNIVIAVSEIEGRYEKN